MFTERIEAWDGKTVRRLEKSVATAGFLLVAVCALLVVSGRPYGRVFSIPSANPEVYWALGAALVGTCLWNLLPTLGRYERPPVAVGLLFAISVTLFTLPVLMGVEFFGSTKDAILHVGFLRTITEAGRVPPDLKYPAVHLYAWLLSATTGFPGERVLMLVPAASVWVFVGGAVLLGDVWSELDRSVALVFPFTLVFTVGGAYNLFTPYMAAVFVFPIVLYLAMQFLVHGDSRYKPLALLFLFELTLLHPIGSLAWLTFVGVALSLTTLSRVVGVDFEPVKNLRQSINRGVAASVVVLVFLVSWMMFYSKFFFASTFYRLYVFVSSPVYFLSKFSDLSNKAETAQDAARAGYDLVGFFLQWYSPMLFVWGITGLVGAWLLYRWDAVPTPDRQPTALLLAWLVAQFFLSGTHPFLGILSVNPTRFVPLVLVGTPVVLGVLVARHRRVAILVVVGFLMLTSVGLTNLYFGPENNHPNPQLTEGDAAAMEWMFEYKNREDPILNYRLHQHRFAAYLLGYGGLESRSDIKNGQTAASTMDDELEQYRQGEPLVKQRTYVPIGEFDEWYVGRYYERLGLKGIFDRFDRDRQADRVFDNGDVRMYVYS